MPKIDIAQHLALETAGFLQIHRHATLPLLIHNYSQKTQFERFWTAETLISRGLVTDLEGHIVARPFAKFFNLDEHIGLFGALPQSTFEVFEKMDGSMGILFHHENELLFATRGSFSSDQAIMAREIFAQKYPDAILNPAHTYLVEIIYPENRIVVNYGEMTDLILLGIIETKTGIELPLENVGLPLVKQYNGFRDLEALREIQEENREGFVIRFENGLRVKVKFEEYVRLHRVVTGLNSRIIWETLAAGNSLDQFLENVPDEFYQWVHTTVAQLKTEFSKIEASAQAEFKHFDDRKAAAEYYLSSTQYPAIMFKMLDNRPYDAIIWQLIRPETTKAFSKTSESDE